MGRPRALVAGRPWRNSSSPKQTLGTWIASLYSVGPGQAMTSSPPAPRPRGLGRQSLSRRRLYAAAPAGRKGPQTSVASPNRVRYDERGEAGDAREIYGGET